MSRPRTSAQHTQIVLSSAMTCPHRAPVPNTHKWFSTVPWHLPTAHQCQTHTNGSQQCHDMSPPRTSAQHTQPTTTNGIFAPHFGVPLVWCAMEMTRIALPGDTPQRVQGQGAVRGTILLCPGWFWPKHIASHFRLTFGQSGYSRSEVLVSVWVDARTYVQGGSNMTGTNCDLFTHKSSRSYLNHLVCMYAFKYVCVPEKNELFSRQYRFLSATISLTTYRESASLTPVLGTRVSNTARGDDFSLPHFSFYLTASN